MRQLLQQNPILRLLAINIAVGAALGLAFVAAILAFDLHGIGRLLAASPDALPALALLGGGFVITFGSVVAGSAIMLHFDRRDEPSGGSGADTGVDAVAPLRARAR